MDAAAPEGRGVNTDHSRNACAARLGSYAAILDDDGIRVLCRLASVLAADALEQRGVGPAEFEALLEADLEPPPQGEN